MRQHAGDGRCRRPEGNSLTGTKDRGNRNREDLGLLRISRLASAADGDRLRIAVRGETCTYRF